MDLKDRFSCTGIASLTPREIEAFVDEQCAGNSFETDPPRALRLQVDRGAHRRLAHAFPPAREDETASPSR